MFTNAQSDVVVNIAVDLDVVVNNAVIVVKYDAINMRFTNDDGGKCLPGQGISFRVRFGLDRAGTHRAC